MLQPTVVAETEASTASDFNFLFGRWQVHNERLQERLSGCSTWDSFAAVAECRPVLGGVGNIESFQTDWQGGFRGLALRLFDPSTQRWRIHWASDRSGVLDAPVIGRFENGVGNFFGPEQHRGTTVLSRYRWSELVGPDSAGSDHPASKPGARRATWDQAWSRDDGRSWETNWIMRFTRIDDPNLDAGSPS